MEQVTCIGCSNVFNRKASSQRFCSLGCSTGYRTRVAARIRIAQESKEYVENPKPCLHCKEAIPWGSKGEHRRKVFCSSSCAASVNNKVPKRKAAPKVAKPSQDSLRMERFLRGKISKRATIVRLLLRMHGRRCWTCLRTEWEGQPIPVELDHIDGNPGNDMPINLRLLCPNCHAQTPTHKGRNLGSGRRARGLPMQ